MNSNSRSTAPYWYLCITLAWTWLCWFGAVLTGQHFLEFPANILSLLGFLGPLAVAAVMVKLGYWDRSLKEFMKSCFDLRRLGLRWIIFILVLVVVLVGVPLLILGILSGKSLAELINLTPTFLLIPGVLAGALEEPGWRGYAQEALQRRASVLSSSLVIGLFWALWHWPLFFLSGYYHASLGFGSSAFWFFNLSILVGSVIYGWLYNRAGRVAAAAVFYHALGNLGRIVFAVEDSGLEIEGAAGIDVVELIDFGVEALLALVIVLTARQLMLKRRSEPKVGLESG